MNKGQVVIKKRNVVATVLAVVVFALYLVHLQQEYIPEVMIVNGQEVSYNHQLMRQVDNRHDQTPNFARNQSSDYDIEVVYGGEPFHFSIYERERYVLVGVTRNGELTFREVEKPDKTKEMLAQYPKKEDSAEHPIE